MTTLKIHGSVHTFDDATVGTRVITKTGKELISAAIRESIHAAKFENGQAFIMLPEWTKEHFSAGVGLLNNRKEGDFIVRNHRGSFNVYLRREFSAPVEGVAAVVYTRDAMLADPDTTQEERPEIEAADQSTFYVVAILAFAGPKSPFPLWNLGHNLGGGNAEWVPNGDEAHDAALARKTAAAASETMKYFSMYCMVSD